MSPQVIGAGMMFLGSGCGPALSDDQREYLKNVHPNEFYPLERLLAMFELVQQSSPELIYATGRRWGNAIKDDMIGRGAKTVKEALFLVPKVYLEHHQGDVGSLTLIDAGPTAVLLTNDGPYPALLIAGAFQSLAAAMGAEEVQLLETANPQQYRISWEQGE